VTTLAEQLASARRELALRRRVYPIWVSQGRMNGDQAGHETACMAAIVVTLEKLAALAEVSAALNGRKDAYDVGSNQSGGADDHGARAVNGLGAEAVHPGGAAAGPRGGEQVPAPARRAEVRQEELTL